MTIETNEALLAKAKDAKVLLSKDTGSAAALLSKAAEEAKVLLSKAVETIEADETAKALLNEAAETAKALLNEAAETAGASLNEAAETAEVLLSKAAETAEVLLARVKRLEGIFPICSHCKKIRDDKGYWNQIEAYIEKHSDAEFSHSICQECAKKYYPDMNLYDEDEIQQ